MVRGSWECLRISPTAYEHFVKWGLFKTWTRTRRMRVLYLGKEIDIDDLPDGAEPPASYYFDRVEISHYAIDQASKIVPEGVWKTVGLYTWLSRQSNAAFQRLEVGQYDIQGRNLHFFFKRKSAVPRLEEVKHVKRI